MKPKKKKRKERSQKRFDICIILAWRFLWKALFEKKKKMQNNQHYDLVILPPPWVPQVDQQEGKLVYFNPILNVVSEEHPAFFPIPYYTPINFTLPPWIGQSYVWIITLSKAKDLVDKRIIGKANPFAISALDLENYKTKKISNTLNPQW